VRGGFFAADAIRIYGHRSGKVGLGRRTYRLKPSANVNLGVSFAAEMAGFGAAPCVRIPLEHAELVVAALNDEPMGRVIGHASAYFAPKFLKSRHAVHLTSYVCTRLRIIFATHSSPIAVFSMAW